MKFTVNPRQASGAGAPLVQGALLQPLLPLTTEQQMVAYNLPNWAWSVVGLAAGPLGAPAWVVWAIRARNTVAFVYNHGVTVYNVVTGAVLEVVEYPIDLAAEGYQAFAESVLRRWEAKSGNVAGLMPPMHLADP